MSQISSSYSGTLTAFFDDRDDAEDAVARLIQAGIPESSVRLVPGHENDVASSSPEKVHKGFFESLAEFFMPEEDRYSYAEGLRRGGYLVTASNIPQELRDTAIDILDDEGAIDFDEREESWRTEGWSGYSEGQSGLSSSAGSYGTSESTASSGTYASTQGSGYGSTQSSGYSERTSASLGDEAIPVVQEELRIGKRDVNLGRVRVRSYVVEEPVSEQVNLREERVVLERRPVDRELSASDTAFQDRTIEAEEHAEQAVVAKNARVVEEIGLRKETDQRTETVSDTVRHTEVEVEDDRDVSTRNTSLNR